MITQLLDNSLPPSSILQYISQSNINHEIKTLIKALNLQKEQSNIDQYKAHILDTANLHTGTLTLHYNETGNISIRMPQDLKQLPSIYSLPGKTFLFTIDNTSFSVQRYTIGDNGLKDNGSIIINGQNPLYIDGAETLYECTSNIAYGSLTLVDKQADISVFDRQTLQKIAWLPNDESAARFLVSLELLAAAEDTHRRKVAEELVYHTHPAVAWSAFNAIAEEDRQAALVYAPVMRLLQNDKLNEFLDRQLGCAQ